MTAIAIMVERPAVGAPPGRERSDVVERELVVRACAGDPDAREELARSCGRAAYAFALQLSGDPDQAQDVAQDSLLRFFRSLGRFDTDRPVVPWLFQIVRNRTRDLQRRARTRGVETSQDELAARDVPRVERLLEPDAQSEASQLRRVLWECVGALEPSHREILVLRDYQDLAYREIAAVLGIPIGTVMSRLHAARKRLRHTVLERGYDFGAGR